MQSATKGQRVWIAILPKREADQPRRTAGSESPTALVPGIVLDPNPMTRTVVRGDREVTVQRAVDVVSYHELPDGRTFYKHQGQGLIGLHDRRAFVPAIDGPDDVPVTTGWVRTVVQLAKESQDSIVAQPSDDLIAEAEAQYSQTTAPALV